MTQTPVTRNPEPQDTDTAEDLPNGDLPWIAERAAKCEACETWRKGRICLKCREKYPERDCIIAVGIRMPKAHCPIGEWGKQ